VTAAVLERLLHVLDQDVRMVDRLRHIADAAVRPFPQYFVTGGVHRENLAGVAVLLEIALRPGRGLGRIAGRAHQRNRARREQRLR
jgi:hypothetical protein